MIINPYAFGTGGGGGGLPHRYWRVNITANDGSALYMGFTEIELRGSAGGADMTVSQPSVGASTASSIINADNEAPKAVDNLDTTGWLSSTATPPQWWKYDFGHASHTGPNTTENVLQILIKGSHNVPTASPKDFTLQWSDDDSAWTTVLTITGQTGWTGASDARAFTV